MRPVTALFCLGLSFALSGCFSAGATGDAAPEIASATAPERVAEPDPSPMPAGRAATAPKPPRTRTAAAASSASASKDESWQEGGVTREKINGMCWMKAEKAGRSVSAEKKAEIVDKCVEETLKEYPVD